MELYVSIATILGTVIAIIAMWQQNKKDQIKKAESMAILKKTVTDNVKSIDHCHDKVRDLYSKNNESSVIIGKIQTTIEENTRVLRMLENAIINWAKVEQKIDSHIGLGHD